MQRKNLSVSVRLMHRHRHTHNAECLLLCCVCLSQGGGARIGEVDAACAPHHFIIPVGRAPTTGCAGQMVYTGAHGYNERMHGLGVDHMTSAIVVVTRNGGEIVNCSADQEADLFWAIKGGGPNIGIICEMTVRAEPYSQVVIAVMCVWCSSHRLRPSTRASMRQVSESTWSPACWECPLVRL